MRFCGPTVLWYGVVIAVTTTPIALIAAVPTYGATPTASASVQAGTLTYTAASGQANQVTLTAAGFSAVLTDVVPVTAGAGCVSLSATGVSCGRPFSRIVIDTLDGDDTVFKKNETPTVVRTGDGADSVTVELAREADEITDIDAGPGDDIINGGGGAERIDGGTGADRINGGAGDDGVSYAGRNAAVTVRLDDAAAGNGEANEGDVITGVEDAVGGAGNDLLIGNAAANHLVGGSGDDTVQGFAGPDFLDGAAGKDTLYGGTETDTLLGGAGDDLVYGQEAWDRIEGGPGKDRIFGGDGDDYLLGDPNAPGLATFADYIDGEAGRDTVSYWGRSAPIVADLDNALGDDGERGEGDSILNAENLIGGDGADVLTGNAGTNDIEGRAGNDRLVGLGGDDVLSGEEGADRLDGGSGNDTLSGGPGSDRLDGGAGTDTCQVDADGGTRKNCER
jgi:Ca2+-binding RTX toxin-like protein